MYLFYIIYIYKNSIKYIIYAVQNIQKNKIKIAEKKKYDYVYFLM